MPWFFTVHVLFNKMDISWTLASSIDWIDRLFAFLCTERTFKIRSIKLIIAFLMNLIRARFQFSREDILSIFKKSCKIIITQKILFMKWVHLFSEGLDRVICEQFFNFKFLANDTNIFKTFIRIFSFIKIHCFVVVKYKYIKALSLEKQIESSLLLHVIIQSRWKIIHGLNTVKIALFDKRKKDRKHSMFIK